MLVQVPDSHHQNQISNFVICNYRLFDDAHLVLLGQVSQGGLKWGIGNVLEKIHSFFLMLKSDPWVFSGIVSVDWKSLL